MTGRGRREKNKRRGNPTIFHFKGTLVASVKRKLLSPFVNAAEFLFPSKFPRGEVLLILSSASVQANRLQFMSVLVRPTPVTLFEDKEHCRAIWSFGLRWTLVLGFESLVTASDSPGSCDRPRCLFERATKIPL